MRVSCLFFFLFLMLFNAVISAALAEDSVGTKPIAMRGLPQRGAGRHAAMPVSDMHPLRAPVPSGNGAALGRIEQKEKRVLIHGTQLLRSKALVQ